MTKSARIDKVSTDIEGQVVVSFTVASGVMPTRASKNGYVFRDQQDAVAWANSVLDGMPDDVLIASAMISFFSGGKLPAASTASEAAKGIKGAATVAANGE